MKRGEPERTHVERPDELVRHLVAHRARVSRLALRPRGASERGERAAAGRRPAGEQVALSSTAGRGRWRNTCHATDAVEPVRYRHRSAPELFGRYAEGGEFNTITSKSVLAFQSCSCSLFCSHAKPR